MKAPCFAPQMLYCSQLGQRGLYVLHEAKLGANAVSITSGLRMFCLFLQELHRPRQYTLAAACASNTPLLEATLLDFIQIRPTFLHSRVIFLRKGQGGIKIPCVFRMRSIER